VQDDDCHWYIIPAEKRKEFSAWIGSSEYEMGRPPEWAKMVDGIGNMTFENPKFDQPY
jgi:hypothetical protein